ncbi:ABC transporter substrate-binding protein [Nonomuraea diastatica]|uniref:Extracellular solute-binding protein n=1 Tax=Nonomuraea diastatica TaxID=1848329 RepID=A0A4R4WZF1_9ACTN|nr:extracellular solute-binding protein [Nonomuraea diastatica]TDD23122.1 extracellular solute-binding protein [Nonomuraea diastatica]
MDTLSRRRFIQATGLMGVMAAAACGGGGTGSGGSAGKLTWWDAQESGKEAKEALLKKFAESPGGIPVEYTHVSAAKFPQAIQLAKQSKQLPDIHVNVGITAEVEQLIKDGWVAPLELGDAAVERLKGDLYEGMHTFDGKVYSWPIYHIRQYMTVNWFDTTMVAKAGLDPNTPPATYDEFRAACAATQKASAARPTASPGASACRSGSGSRSTRWRRRAGSRAPTAACSRPASTPSTTTPTSTPSSSCCPCRKTA